jgi:DNA anti-recombination protein RmuC
MLMLAVQTVWAILKDAEFREQTVLIKKDVTNLLTDVNRLEDRTFLLGEILKRGNRIENLDFE